MPPPRAGRLVGPHYFLKLVRVVRRRLPGPGRRAFDAPGAYAFLVDPAGAGYLNVCRLANLVRDALPTKGRLAVNPASRLLLSAAFALTLLSPATRGADPWVVYRGGDGPGKGKHVVLVSGDEEYRSEETLPQLGKILAKRHGFTCTVLFALDKDGTINPNVNNNIPGLEHLKSADLMVIFTRFRNLPDGQLKHVVDYVESGRPVVGLRTATHAFNLSNKESPYASWTWTSKVKGFEGGFGKQVLGETWVSHHGAHGKESTRGVIAPDAAGHPVVRGLKDGDIWGPTDVYGVRLPLPGDSKTLVYGQVLKGMKPDDEPVAGKKNDPMMPLAWTKSYTVKSGKAARVFTTTMGASQDFASDGLRRLLVNACYWAVGSEDRIPEKANVDLVGAYEPRPFRNNGFKKGVRPADHALGE